MSVHYTKCAPARFSLLSGLTKGRSVLASRRMLYCGPESFSRHSASESAYSPRRCSTVIAPLLANSAAYALEAAVDASRASEPSVTVRLLAAWAGVAHALTQRVLAPLHDDNERVGFNDMTGQSCSIKA